MGKAAPIHQMISNGDVMDSLTYFMGFHGNSWEFEGIHGNSSRGTDGIRAKSHWVPGPIMSHLLPHRGSENPSHLPWLMGRLQQSDVIQYVNLVVSLHLLRVDTTYFR